MFLSSGRRARHRGLASASTVWEILREAGIEPAPDRAATTWTAHPIQAMSAHRGRRAHSVLQPTEVLGRSAHGARAG
jgi:hypothetical protein